MRWPIFLVVVSLAACEGFSGLASDLLGEKKEVEGDGEVDGEEAPVDSSRIPRLSHRQYENTLRDLLGLDAPLGITSSFVGDATSGVFDNNGAELVVNGDLWADYQRAAETAAETATATPQALAKLTFGTTPTQPADFVRALGARVFRRPLTSGEIDAFVAIYGKGAEYYPKVSSASTAGARVVLEAMLQSPQFLYRIELSEGALTEWELASRLSYALWQSMPDQALTAAAQSGALSGDGYAAQVQRLLADPRAEETVRTFHAQLFRVSLFADITRSTTLFPEFSTALRASMIEEPLRFSADVYKGQGDLAQLLTAPHSFIDANLAKVYKLTAPGSGFARVNFTDGRRAGLLTQVGFLALNSTATDPAAIHRGVFLNRRILCAPLAAPGMAAPPLPADDPNDPKTLRERVTIFTGTGTCGALCHGTMINPAGFAFEHYDALARWRETDKNKPVNAADEYSFEGTMRPFDGGPQFAQIVSQESMTHRCYAKHWTEFLYGRASADEDKPLTARVGRASLEQHISMRAVMEAVVTSPVFKKRPVNP
jgi:hypothetical protein